MNDLYFSEKILKYIRERQAVVKDQLCYGAVPNDDTFKLLRARLAVLAEIEEEVQRINRQTEEGT